MQQISKTNAAERMADLHRWARTGSGTARRVRGASAHRVVIGPDEGVSCLASCAVREQTHAGAARTDDKLERSKNLRREWWLLKNGANYSRRCWVEQAMFGTDTRTVSR